MLSSWGTLSSTRCTSFSSSFHITRSGFFVAGMGKNLSQPFRFAATSHLTPPWRTMVSFAFFLSGTLPPCGTDSILAGVAQATSWCRCYMFSQLSQLSTRQLCTLSAAMPVEGRGQTVDTIPYACPAALFSLLLSAHVQPALWLQSHVQPLIISVT